MMPAMLDRKTEPATQSKFIVHTYVVPTYMHAIRKPRLFDDCKAWSSGKLSIALRSRGIKYFVAKAS